MEDEAGLGGRRKKRADKEMMWINTRVSVSTPLLALFAETGSEEGEKQRRDKLPSHFPIIPYSSSLSSFDLSLLQAISRQTIASPSHSFASAGLISHYYVLTCPATTPR